MTITSLADQPRSGTVRVANRFFGAGFTPALYELPYAVGPRGSVELRFPVPRAQANLAISYEMRATISDSSGLHPHARGRGQLPGLRQDRDPDRH